MVEVLHLLVDIRIVEHIRMQQVRSPAQLQKGLDTVTVPTEDAFGVDVDILVLYSSYGLPVGVLEDLVNLIRFAGDDVIGVSSRNLLQRERLGRIVGFLGYHILAAASLNPGADHGTGTVEV